MTDSTPAQASDITPSFQNLAPSAHSNISDIYTTALTKAVTDSEVYNIALTGPYGAGKSSVLKNFLQHKPPHINELSISLAAFETDNEPTSSMPAQDDDNSAQESSAGIAKDDLEMRILQQLIYSVESDKLPQSRFQRIIAHRRYHIYAHSAALWLLGVWVMTSQWQNFLGLTEWSFTWIMSWCLFIATFFITAAGIERLLKEFTRSGIKKISLTKLEVEAGGEQQSILSQFLDEILYFFEETDTNLVIFEDIDRFDDPNIFIKLREINTIINSNAGIRAKHRAKPGCDGNIRFLYALKDSMFSEKQRTKFFDMIVPVVPVFNHGNAEQLFITRLRQIPKLNERIDIHFVMDVAEFVNDPRVIHNTVNELIIYDRVVQLENLNPNIILAILLYKNLFSKDFELLHNREGFFWFLLNSRQSLLKQASDDTPETASLAELLTAKREFIDQCFSKYHSLHPYSGIDTRNQAWRLLKFLLLNGYLNEDFLYYISVINDQNYWTSKDRLFYTSIKSGESISSNTDIDNPDTILRRLNDKNFAHPAVIKVELFDSALGASFKTEQNNNRQNTEKAIEQQKKLFLALKGLYHREQDLFRSFIRQYCMKGIQHPAFFTTLLATIPSYFNDVFDVDTDSEGTDSILIHPRFSEMCYLIRAVELAKFAAQHESGELKEHSQPEKFIQTLLSEHLVEFLPRLGRDKEDEKNERLNALESTAPKEPQRSFTTPALLANMAYFRPIISDVTEIVWLLRDDEEKNYYSEWKRVRPTDDNILLQEFDLQLSRHWQQRHALDPLFTSLITEPYFAITKRNILLVLAQQIAAAQDAEDSTAAQSMSRITASTKTTSTNQLPLATALKLHQKANNYQDKPAYARELSQNTWYRIMSLPSTKLLESLSKNINSYIENYMLNNDDNRWEPDIALRDILASGDLDEELGKKVIIHQHHVFSDLENIPEVYWQTLVAESKVDASWHSLLLMFRSDFVSPESMLEFINDISVVNTLAASVDEMQMEMVIFPNRDLQDLWEFILRAESLDDDHYTALLSCFPKRLDTLPENLPENKLRSLIDAGLVEFNARTYEQTQRNKALRLALILRYESKFLQALKLNQKFAELDEALIEDLLFMPISNTLKVALTQKIPTYAFQLNARLATLAAPFYVRLSHNKVKSDVLSLLCRQEDDPKLSAALLLKLFEKRNDENYLSLLIEKIPHWPAALIVEVLKQHPNKQYRALVFDPPNTVHVNASPAMERLLKALQKQQLVEQFEVKEQHIHVKTQRLNIDENSIDESSINKNKTQLAASFNESSQLEAEFMENTFEENEEDDLYNETFDADELEEE